jgi:hypothetical protein
MKTNISITEATEQAAFLTNANGYDVAVLRRVVPQDSPETPANELLSDEQWQELINLIAAAPDLLKAVEEMLKAWEEQFGEGACDCRKEPQNHGHVCQCCKARLAIESLKIIDS